MRPGPVDLARLRRQPHRTKVYLGIYKPSVALACQINDADIPHSAREITYDNITEGSADLVIPGMTVYIGSNPGGFDRGRLRVKDISDSVLTVAENDVIEWADNLYLTVKRFFEPWGIYPRIVLDGDNIPSFFKDYDIAYTDQNQVFDPVVHMGPHLAAFRETGTVSLDYSSSGSFDPADESTPTGTAWWFEGATPTGSGNPHPSLIQYPVSGHYTTHLTVVSDQGKSFTGRRHVMIFDRPGQGDNPPIIGWGLIGIEGQRSSMGYTARMFVKEKADFDKVVNGALVVLFTEDWYGDEKVSIGGNAVDRSNILFVGYIDGESIRYNSFTSRLEFRASSITIIGDLKSDFSDTLESKTSTAFWYEMQNMTIDKAVLHFLRWQSTLLSIADFSWAGNILPVQFADFGRSTISAEVNDLYESALGASLIADRQGKMWAEVDINLTLTGSRSAFVENMELLRQDWVSEIGFDREFIDRVSYIEEGGIAYSGPVSGTMEPFLAGAPGLAPSYEGSVARRTGLVLESQIQVNAFAGLDFARRNMTYPRVDITLAGNYRNFDIAPQEFVLLSLEEADTYRNIVWRGKRFVPQSISISYDPRKELLQYNMTVEEETWAPTGTTVSIPVDPPYDNLDLPIGEITFPPIVIPDPWTPPLPDPDTWDDGATCYAVAYNNGNTGIDLVRTRDMLAASPVWESVEGIISGAYGHFVLDALDPANKAYVQTTRGIYYTTDLDADEPTWAPSLTTAEMRTLVGDGTADWCNALAVTMADPNFICGLAQVSDGAKDEDVYFLWTTDIAGGAAAWSAVSIIANADRDRGRFGGEYGVWVSQHSTERVGATGGGRETALGFHRTNWNFSSDGPGGTWSSTLLPNAVFEDKAMNNVYIPYRDATDQATYTSARGIGEHHYRSTNMGITWFAEIPALVFGNEYAQNIKETAAEARNSSTSRVFFAGHYDLTKSGVCWYDEDANVIISVVNEATFLYFGYGFGIWPYDFNIQWLSDGQKVGKLWLTLNSWATKAEFTGNAQVFSGSNGYFRFIQPVWTP